MRRVLALSAYLFASAQGQAIDGAPASVLDGGVAVTNAITGVLQTGAGLKGKKRECALDGAQATNALLDSAIYIWASVERCGKPGADVKCGVDLASAAESINHMVNLVINALHQCGHVDLTNTGCGLAASQLTKSAIGIAAAAGGIVDKCPNTLKPVAPVAVAGAVDWKHGKNAYCLVDLKNSMNSILEATRATMKVKNTCDKDPDSCAGNVLGIVSALASIGRYLMGAVGHCNRGPLAIDLVTGCASEITNLIGDLTDVARAGEAMAHHCGLAAERLYSEDKLKKANMPTAAGSYVVPVLSAFLPVTAIAAFFAGMRMRSPVVVQESEREPMVEAVVES